MPKLLAISDLHLDFEENRRVLRSLPSHPEDWLLIAGDVGHRPGDLVFALQELSPRFAQLVWVPGNHDLWTTKLEDEPDGEQELRGERKYQHLVSICREHGVLTPEDPFPEVCCGGTPVVVAPLFTLYDYSFRPDDVPLEQAVPWAMESRVLCTDEQYLDPDPFPSRVAWCHARCDATEARLAELPPGLLLVLVNHFPLREDLIRIRIPRFSIWCGTRRTEDWHTRFNVAVVVSGHLHVPRTCSRDGVRFEEVSLGYPSQWQHRDNETLLRQVCP
jgi:predicted phosphodiesterase